MVTARMDGEYGKMATALTCKLDSSENIAIKTAALATESYYNMSLPVTDCRLSLEHIGMLISLNKNGIQYQFLFTL